MQSPTILHVLRWDGLRRGRTLSAFQVEPAVAVLAEPVEAGVGALPMVRVRRHAHHVVLSGSCVWTNAAAAVLLTLAVLVCGCSVAIGGCAAEGVAWGARVRRGRQGYEEGALPHGAGVVAAHRALLTDAQRALVSPPCQLASNFQSNE